MSERSDSLFIIFCGCDTVEKAMFWAKKAATWINDNFFSKPMAVRFTMIFFFSLSSRFSSRRSSKKCFIPQCTLAHSFLKFVCDIF